jgi:hypothetical protein
MNSRQIENSKFQNNTQQQPSPYILFYSEKCETSQHLITLLYNEGLLGNFRKFSLEKDRQFFPKSIDRVPTLIAPEVPRPLVAQEAFQWLQGIKFMRHQQMIEKNKKIAHMNMLKNMQAQNGPNPLITSEMAGFSDGYAYYTDGPVDIDNPQPKSFFGYKEEEKNAIFTHIEMPKITQDEQAKRIQAEEANRKQQDNSFKDIMKAGQLNEIMNYEKEKLANRNRR